MIRDHMLGWDITDYGLGKFDEMGLFLFTVRNGNQANVQRGMGMLYAEKIMISGENQISPMHRHNLKTEDIINRGGATLTLELFKADAGGAYRRTRRGLGPDRRQLPQDGGRRSAEAQTRRKRHAGTRHLARLLGRGRACV